MWSVELIRWCNAPEIDYGNEWSDENLMNEVWTQLVHPAEHYDAALHFVPHIVQQNNLVRMTDIKRLAA